MNQEHPFRLFRNFAQAIWKHLNLPPLTDIQKEVCDWLQFGPERNQTWGFRGVGKSYITSAYCLWLLWWNSEEMILVISASKERADAFVQFTKRLINDVDWLNHLKPDRSKGCRDSSFQFDVGTCTPKHSCSVRAVGITGSITGSRASAVVVDDVEVPSNSDTPMKREKLRTAVSEIDAIILPESKELRIVPRIRILGTPQSMETVYIRLAEVGYKPRIWPVEVPNPETLLGYKGNLAPSIQKMVDDGDEPGTPTEPSRFHREDIAKRRLSYGSLGFALQFMLSTALSDAEKYPLKTKDIIFAPFQVDKAREIYIHSNHLEYKLPEHGNVGMQGDGFYRAADAVGDWVPFDATAVFVDPSGRGKDETAIVSASVRDGYIFVHRVFGTLDGYSAETLEAIARECKRVKANRLVIESNYGDGMFSNLLRPVLRKVYPCTIEEVKHSITKERRIIESLSPVLESHRMVMHEAIPVSDKVPHKGDGELRQRNRQLFYQLTHLTDERGCLANDDRLDCLAICAAHFAPQLSLDALDESRQRQNAWFDEQIEGLDAPDENSWLSSNELGEDSLLNLF